MSDQSQQSVVYGILQRGYQRIFYENWPVWVGAVLFGIMSIITFAWSRPFGIAGGLRNWGDWFFHAVGIYGQSPLSPWLSTSSILTLGFLWGAFGSALMAKQFAIRTAPPLELAKGAVGGILMGIGSAMSGGCNIGGFYSAVSALSMSGVAMLVGLLLGAYLGIRYLFWELEHLPTGSAGGIGDSEEKKGLDWLNLQPYAGIIVFVGGAVMAWQYAQVALTYIGGLLLCGLAFGVIIQRTRLCFARGLRDPFMTGEAEVTKALAISLLIAVIGFTALKWTGLREESMYVPQAFWFGGLVGGIIFGFGMVLAGGCGSGSVWRAGEGQVKLMVAVVCFALSMSLFEAWTASSATLAALMGHRVFLPDVLTYKWALGLLVLLLLAFYLLAAWNEETEKFTVEM